ncbi:uncharacterized protein LOC121393362 [Xenopus laevis]|uniref:Uncharacterized protein LOC121393362 n=1 Tax=Xenopus laevis TaxID=8355 RepID=A0A8J1KLM9_XENLA|nr:uncharacterized protein LOC121393362 [Xenopus laevis]
MSTSTAVDPGTKFSSQAVFAYNSKEIDRILNQSEGINLGFDSRPATEPGKDLLYTEKKLLNLKLHRSALTEYVRAGIIPRGLRADLKPTLCTNNPLMQTRWQEICYKFSTDLMVLTIECLDVEIEEVNMLVISKKQAINEHLESTQASTLFTEQQEILNKLKKEIVSRKQRKYLRDSRDYELNCVYEWREEASKQRRERRGAPPIPCDRRMPVTRSEQTGKYYRPRGPAPSHEEQWEPRQSNPRYYNRTPTLQEGASYSRSEDDYATSHFLGAAHREKKDPRKPAPREPYPRRDRNQKR